MKEFFKPTKINVLLTVVLLLLSSLLMGYFLSFFVSDLMDMCLPNLPHGPLPTPEPLSLSRTLADLKLTESAYPCLRNDPSAQLAFSIQHIGMIIALICFVFLTYCVSCAIIVFAAKLKKQKKRYTPKSKK